MKKVHQILFDFDYTLADSSEGIITCVNFALGAIGHPPAHPSSIRRTIGHSLEHTFGQFIQPPDETLIARCKALFMEHADTGAMVNQTFFLEGVNETLDWLFENLFTLGIVSTKRRSTIEETLMRHEMDDFFDVIVGYEDVKNLKPHPEGIEMAIRELSGEPETTVLVGDSLLDIQAAKAAGIRCIGISSGTTSYGELTKANADRVIKSFSELKSVFAI